MFLFPSPCWKHKWNFLWYLLWEPGWAFGDKSHSIVGDPLSPWLDPLEFLTVRLVHSECPAIHELQLRFSCRNNGSKGGFGSTKLWPPVFTCRSSGQWFSCLTNPRRVVDFSVCSAFVRMTTIGFLCSELKTVYCHFIFQPGFLGTALGPEQLIAQSLFDYIGCA